MTFNKIPLAIGYDPATGNASGLTEFILNLSDVGDVCSAVPSVGQVLAFSGTSWCASTVVTGGGGSTFTCADLGSCHPSSLSGICGTPPTPGQVLSYNGTDYCPSTIVFPSASATLPTGSTGDILVVGEGDSAFGAAVASGTLFDQGIAAKQIATVTSGAAVNFPNGVQSGGSDLIPQQGSLDAGDILIVPQGGSTFTNHIASGDLFDAGIAVKQIATVTSGATTNFPNGIQSGGSDLATEAELLSVSNALLPSSVAGNNEIYYKNAAVPDGLATTTGSRHFITDVVYDPNDLAPGASLVYTGDNDGEGWQLTTAGTGGLGMTVQSPAGATGKDGTVTANSLILVSGTSVSSTRGVALGSNALEFLDNNASATTVRANDLNVTTNITVGGTVDGVDIASRDSVLTSTTTTANNALPKAGGTMTGTLQIDAGAPSMILKDTTDDDDHTIVFRSNADVDEFVIRTGDKFAGLGDNFQLGSTSNNGLTLVTNNAVGLSMDAAQNVTCSGSVSSASVTGVDVTVSGNLNATYTTLANAGITTTLHREVGAPVASSNSTSLAEVASYTLPANVLTLGDIDIMIRGRQLAQGANLRWNFKIAGTNILNSAISQGTYSDFTRYTMHIQISKMATDRQMVTARFIQGTGTGSAAGFSGWSSTHRDGLIHNEATGDESGTLALSLEAQQSNSSQTVTVDQFTVRLIPNAFA